MDLDEWERSLREPFDPFIERFSPTNELVLRSGDFGDMNDRLEVRERALIIIDDLNGALRAISGTGRVDFGSLFEVFTDGTYEDRIYVEADLSFSRFLSAGFGATGGPSGPPTASTAQKWLGIAATNDIVADMLRHFGNEISWYDLYKTFECIEALCGPLGGLKSRSWAPSSPVIKTFTHTANYHRHSRANPARKKPPENPMPLPVAATLIREMVTSLMSDLVP